MTALFLFDFYRTSVGKKIVMALSGFVLVGFVIAHMLGNLKIFTGVDTVTGLHRFDLYAHHLREMGAEVFGYSGVLWIARVVLLVSVVLHLVSAITLAIQNRTAKPVVASDPKYSSASAASRTMLLGGLFLLAFIIYHILHLTIGSVHTRGFVEGQAYSNVVLGFQDPVVAGFYVLAMLFLSLHVFHGMWSMFQTLGLATPRWNGLLRGLARVVALMLFFGFSALPLAVGFGFLKI